MKQLAPDQVPLIGTDPDLMEAFYREHAESMKRFLARRFDDPHQVADLVADIFVAAMESAHRYRPEAGSPGQWIYGIARNVLANHLRRHARRLRAESRIQGRRLLDEDAIAQLTERIEAERLRRELYRALAMLKEKDRSLLELVGVDGLSISEAADVLGLKPATARVRLHRTRARLQQHLASLTPAAVSAATTLFPQEVHP